MHLRGNAEETGPATLYYYLPDHLGSPSIITDGDGKVVEESIFYPYGQDRAKTGTFTSEYRFTGKELDDETGLHYFEARYYDSLVGRFLSVDPLLVEKAEKMVTRSQDMSLYSYVSNNPIKFIDPTGYAYKLSEEGQGNARIYVLSKPTGAAHLGHVAVIVNVGQKYKYFSKKSTGDGSEFHSMDSYIEKKNYKNMTFDEVIGNVNKTFNHSYSSYSLINTSDNKANTAISFYNDEKRSNNYYGVLSNNCEEFVYDGINKANATDRKINDKMIPNFTFINALKHGELPKERSPVPVVGPTWMMGFVVPSPEGTML
jgi:RHS repeat-associated protein